MKQLVWMAAGSLLLLGVGCGRIAAPTIPPTTPPLVNIPTPATSTASSIPEDWYTTERSLLGGLLLSYPGVTLVGQTSDQKTRERVLTVDLGTAVKDIGGKAVPKRTLYADRLIPGDEYYDLSCNATSTRLGSVQQATSTQAARGAALCVRSFTEGAAGNLFHRQEAVVFTSRGGFVIGQVVHSVQCANFEQPEAECVPYDAVRDEALYGQILDTLR